MDTESEDLLNEQELVEELMVIESVHVDNWKQVNSRTFEYIFELDTLGYQTSNKPTTIALKLIIKVPQGYPSRESPSFMIEGFWPFDSNDLKYQLQNELKQLAVDSVGVGVLFMVIDHANEFMRLYCSSSSIGVTEGSSKSIKEDIPDLDLYEATESINLSLDRKGKEEILQYQN